MPTSRLRPRARRLGWALFVWCAATASLPAQSITKEAESISPQPDSPMLEGLPSRAVPIMPVVHPDPVIENSYVPLFRLNDDYYSGIFSIPVPASPFLPDPSSYRAVTAYEPIQGLHPQKPG